MLTILLLIVATLVLFGLSTLKNSKKQRKYRSNALTNKGEKEPPIQEHRFHSVSVVNNGNGCEKANALSGKRFLSKEAPELPMEECTQANCLCRYQHHQDRRQFGHDRRIDYGVTRDLYGAFGEQNRRDNPRGRRATDFMAK